MMAGKENDNKKKSSENLDKQLLELTALFEISRSLTSSLSLRSILENIIRIPMGHMLISKGIILLKKKNTNEFVVEELKGLPHNLLEKSLSILTPPTRSISISGIEEDDEWIDFFREFEIELLLPLDSSEGTIGIVGFGRKIGGKPFEEREIEFLDSLSNIATTSVTNGLMVEEIQTVNRQLDRKIQKLNTIFDISSELNMTLDREKIGSLLCFAVMGELLVNRCAVFTKENGNINILVAKGVSSDFEICAEFPDITEPQLLDDEDERFEQIKKMGFAVLVPMSIQDQNKGLMAIGPKIFEGTFHEEDLEFLKTLGNQAMASLENARLFEEAIEKQKMEEELNLAKKIQQGLLPSEIPAPHGYELAALNIPSRQVGGDYFDIIKISEQLYGIAIADVSGKGAGAALLMANLQASLRALVNTQISISEMVLKINQLVYQNTDLDKFITFFYGQLDTKNNMFTYCNAGHNPPYHIKKDNKLHELSVGGLILGMMPDVVFETASISLEQGDSIVMYTDGVTEALNDKEEEFGEERLENLIKKNSKFSSEQMLNKIVTDVQSFSENVSQYDDITLVLLKVT
jgi:sigma-B regulation protein RsbU (phosphoserine phosphatase)